MTAREGQAWVALMAQGRKVLAAETTHGADSPAHKREVKRWRALQQKYMDVIT